MCLLFTLSICPFCRITRFLQYSLTQKWNMSSSQSQKRVCLSLCRFVCFTKVWDSFNIHSPKIEACHLAKDINVSACHFVYLLEYEIPLIFIHPKSKRVISPKTEMCLLFTFSAWVCFYSSEYWSFNIHSPNRSLSFCPNTETRLLITLSICLF